MIYIDNGNTIKAYFTSRKLEKAIQTYLEYPNSIDGSAPWNIEYSTDYTVLILSKNEKNNLLLAKERGELNIWIIIVLHLRKE